LENQKHLQASQHESLKNYLADLLKQNQPSASQSQASSSGLSSSSQYNRPHPSMVNSFPLASSFNQHTQFSHPLSSPISINHNTTSPISSTLPNHYIPIFTQATCVSTQPQQPYFLHHDPTQLTQLPYYSYNTQIPTFPAFPSQFSPLTNHTNTAPPHTEPLNWNCHHSTVPTLSNGFSKPTNFSPFTKFRWKAVYPCLHFT